MNNNSVLSKLLLRIMIEFCTKKRMILAIAFMLGISVLVLVIENNIPLGHALKEITDIFGNTSKECWHETKYKLVEECSPCLPLDMKMFNTCQPTGYKETVRCMYQNGTSKDVNRSCPRLSWVEERNFWIFESVTAVIGLCSYGVVCMRQKRLDRMLLEKVHKQIAAGV